MKTKIMFCTIVLLLSVFTGSVLGAGEGNYNTFFGIGAGNSTTGDDDNDTFIGSVAGYFNTTGGYNTFVGQSAGYRNTTGWYNTFVGTWAGQYNTTASYNTFIGHQAGYNNSTGANNTFLGHYAGNRNTTGASNTFQGYEAGYLNTTGYYNTFQGYQAGYSNTAGIGNTFIGLQAGVSNTTGGANIFLGNAAGYSNSTGSGNVFLGYYAGYNETGSNKLYIDNSNTATPLIYGEFDNNKLTINGNLSVVGPDNGLVHLTNVTTNNTTKVSRMVLNHYSNSELPVYLFGAASTATDNFVAFGGGNTIGNAATQIDLFTAENPTTPVGTPRLTIIGNGYVGIGIQDPLYPLEMDSGARVTIGGVWTNASSRDYKDNIEALATEEALVTLKGLNPVKFAYKRDRTERHIGFIAEDVPELIATKDRKGLSPMDIVAVLTKVVQELKAENEALKADNGSLKADISSLAQRLTTLEGKGVGSK
jgi:hypothetical protein